MSKNTQPSRQKASQLLNFNMENISHELSALLIGGELNGLGAIGGGPTLPAGATASGAPQLQANVYMCDGSYVSDTNSSITADRQHFVHNNEAQIWNLRQQYTNYQHQLHYQQLQHFYYLQQQQQQQNPMLPITNAFSEFAYPAQERFTVNSNNGYISSGPQLKAVVNQQVMEPNGCAAVTSAGALAKPNSSPKFEFHYLRSHSPNRHPLPLISNATRNIEAETDRRNSSGGIGGNNNANLTVKRKYSKQQLDDGNSGEIDYDKITVDMSLLGLSADNKEVNPVLRLFAHFRKIHYYLNDNLNKNIDIVEHGANAKANCAMPCTMNVQYQVKHLARRCTLFIYEMQRLLLVNKIYSVELYLECEQPLNVLRKLLAQVEAFRRIEMEHKRGQFVTDVARAQSQKLEQLLEHLSDKIRETHIYVHAFNWAVQHTKQYTTAYNQCNIFEQKIVKANELVAAGPPATMLTANPSPVAIPANELTTNTTVYDGGDAFAAALLSATNCDPSVTGFTASLHEFDIERQSTRYIGYK